MITKVVISPSNKKAIAFLDELSKSKADLKKKLEEKATEKSKRSIKSKN